MLSDEKGYAFTPLTLLLFIPIVILAISYGNIVSEANMLANIATGGDVTYTVSKDIVHNMELGAESSGRHAAYLATRSIIDNRTNGGNIFFKKGESKTFIKEKIAEGINNQLINVTGKLSNGTGRDVYINNKLLTEDNSDCISANNLDIYQKDPFGFYVTIKPGIPVKVVQEGQVYMGLTPNITSYVSIEGLEDAYIWIKAEEKYNAIFYKYPYYSNKSDALNTKTEQYFFSNGFNTSDSQLHYLWDCLNGTNNPSGIEPTPYYFPDKEGLSFFDRLEGRNLNDRYDNENARLSSFVLGDPIPENNEQLVGGKVYHSAVDSEYFGSNKKAFKVVLYKRTNKNEKIADLYDPLNAYFALSEDALNRFFGPSPDTWEKNPNSEKEVKLYV